MLLFSEDVRGARTPQSRHSPDGLQPSPADNLHAAPRGEHDLSHVQVHTQT